MKNSFSILELILTLLISSTIIIYSSIFLKESFINNQNHLQLSLSKIQLNTTKIFLEKHKASLSSLKFFNNSLFFEDNLLLERVKTFEINKKNKTIDIEISLENGLKQNWKYDL